MIGGEPGVVAQAAPIFAAVAPVIEAAPRPPGRTGEVAASEQGYLHCGPTGAGHFVKMVHNGIEYGMMASQAEALNILHHADIGTRTQHSDAETAPLEDPQYYRYDIDVAEVAEVWRRGNVIGSWLLDLTVTGLTSNPTIFDHAIEHSSGHCCIERSGHPR